MTPLYPFSGVAASELGNAISSFISGSHRWIQRHKGARILAFTSLAIITLMAAGYFALQSAVNSGALGEVPNRRQLANISTAEASRVLSADGQQLGKYFLTERVTVERADIAPALVHALVATEDARFYKHAGYDIEAWGRVLFKTILGGDGSSGGGSTITQQLVKNLYGRTKLCEQPTLSLVGNKIREVFVARELERAYSKDQILSLYLNTVAFPDNTYGIGVASKRYFGKTPAELSVEEAASLIGALKATYTYDPLRNPSQAYYRRNTVLDLMALHGYIGHAERDSLQALPIRLHYRRDEHNSGLATHFREHARLKLKGLLADLNDERGTDYDLYTDGLVIETTIDAGMQRHAEEAVQAHIAELQDQFYNSLRADQRPWEVEETYTLAYNSCDRVRRMRTAGFGESYVDSVMRVAKPMRLYDHKTAGAKEVEMSPADSIGYCLGLLNAGFMAVEPSTGAIKAWVGGTNHEFFKYDKVTSRRSVGSTFKPIVYAAALRQNIDPTRYWGNYRRTYSQYENWSPRNSGDEYGGSYNMAGGLTNSLNTISVQLMMRTGPENVVELAREMGITTPLPAVPSLALGAGELSLHEMLQAYSVIANRGQRTDLRYIERIRDRNGKLIYDAAAEGPKTVAVLSTEDADLMCGMLENVIDQGTGRRVRWKYKLTGDVAGKTGTSQNHSDGWFIGFTPRLLAGAWTGAESPAVRFRSITYGQGAHMALPIWGRFMQALESDDRYAFYLKGKFPTPNAYVAEVLEQPLRYSDYIGPEDWYEAVAEEPVATTTASKSAPIRKTPAAHQVASTEVDETSDTVGETTESPKPAVSTLIKSEVVPAPSRASEIRRR